MSERPSGVRFFASTLLIVNFSSDELLSNQSVTISGQNSSINDIGNNQYTGYYVMTGSEPEGVISFEILDEESPCF